MASSSQNNNKTDGSNREDSHHGPENPQPIQTQSKFTTIHRPYALSSRQQDASTAQTHDFQSTAAAAVSLSEPSDTTQPTSGTLRSPQMQRWLQQGLTDEPYHTVAAVETADPGTTPAEACHGPPSDATVSRGSSGTLQRY